MVLFTLILPSNHINHLSGISPASKFSWLSIKTEFEEQEWMGREREEETPPSCSDHCHSGVKHSLSHEDHARVTGHLGQSWRAVSAATHWESKACWQELIGNGQSGKGVVNSLCELDVKDQSKQQDGEPVITTVTKRKQALVIDQKNKPSSTYFYRQTGDSDF